MSIYYDYEPVEGDDRPTPAELADIEAESREWLDVRIRAHNRWCEQNPEQARAAWERANEENIARGWGPLPF